MNDLVEEIKGCFERSRDDVVGDDPHGMIVTTQGDDLAPGFQSMKGYYEQQLLIMMRRAYRHHAGAILPAESDALIQHTALYLRAPMIAVTMGAFTDGVMISHQNDHLVKMMVHFHNVGHLFHDDDFRASSIQMAKGFADDKEVIDYFDSYVGGALSHIAHVTGFAHTENVASVKVWDVWLLTGTACITAAYLAGVKMGTTWRERDVLDGIEMASESEGEDGAGL